MKITPFFSCIYFYFKIKYLNMEKEKKTSKTSKAEPKETPKKKAAAPAKTVKETKKTAPQKTPAKKSDKKESEVFAVIQTGGKQYLVRPGETLKIEKIVPPEKGDTIAFEEILLVFDGKDAKIGTPYVSGAKVTAKIEGDEKDKKISVIHYKSKTRQFKKKGHRQIHTKITILDIK